MQLSKLEEQKLKTIAARIAELGHPTRLAIFKYLVKSGRGGAPVGVIQQALNIPASTLSHHLAKMVAVGLIKQVRESRILYCFPVFDSLQDIIDYLQDECCAMEQKT